MASVYRPGQGINHSSVQKLKERKCAEAAITDIPAKDESQQWDRLLGIGAEKKLRCGGCTRPLSKEDQRLKRLVCIDCSLRDTPRWATQLRVACNREYEFLGKSVLYYSIAHRLLPKDPPVAALENVAQKSNGSQCDKPREAEALSSATMVIEDFTGKMLPRGVALSWSDAVPEGRTAFSVLSFNVLADCYVQVEGQPWNAFTHCDEAMLAWQARRPHIIDMLKTSKSDVICLQEVVLEQRSGSEEWTLPTWIDELDGYRSVLLGLKQKDFQNASSRNLRCVGRAVPTAVVTLYNDVLFEEFESSKHGSGSGITLFLRCRNPSQQGGKALEFAISNVHLLGDPSKASEHLKALNSVKKNIGKHELRFICGDFNSDLAPSGDVAKWARHEGFHDCPTGNSWAEPGVASRLDHILSSGDLQVLAVTAGLSNDEIASGLPCASCPFSDHLPVAAVFSGAMKTRCPW